MNSNTNSDIINPDSGTNQNFQGVVCFCLESNGDVRETIYKLLNAEKLPSNHNNCVDLMLKNKYYEATIQLLNYNKIESDSEQNEKILKDCHAIILYGDGTQLDDQLNSKLHKFNCVQDGPRILLCDNIEEHHTSYETLRQRSIEDGYDILLTCDDDVETQLINSLSAYKWPHRYDTAATSSSSSSVASCTNDKRELDGGLLKKLVDFDSLLNKLSAYREQPELRGDPNDKNIEEIAEILSGLLGDDVDNFLDPSDDGVTTSKSATTN